MCEKFWMIWRESYDVPRKKHLTAAEAYQEAERLARKHPGSKFYILEMVNMCEVSMVHWLYEPEMPF